MKHPYYHHLSSLYFCKILFTLTVSTLISAIPFLKGNEAQQPPNPLNEVTTTLAYKRAYTDYFKEGFSGFIRYENYFDTRQVIGVADDNVLFLPAPPLYDPNGADINAKGQFNQTIIISRLRYYKLCPDIHCAKTSIFLETDFFGNNCPLLASTNNQFIMDILRMRHGFITLNWCNSALIVGHTWHPLYIFDCFPNTISFGGGTPIAMYSRSPQIRMTYHGNHIDFLGAITSQLDFPSLGPIGQTSKYLRDAVVPNLHAQIRFHRDSHTVGFGIDYKRLVPRLVTKKGYKAQEQINSMIALAYYILVNKKARFNMQLFYAQNANDMSVLGGFAVHSINPKTDHRTYTNLNTINWWGDITLTQWKHGEPGIFFGYTHNLGARKTIIPTITPPDELSENFIYAFAPNVEKTFSIIPRFHFLIKDFEVNCELVYSAAWYGTIGVNGKVYDSKPVSVVRLLTGVLYYF